MVHIRQAYQRTGKHVCELPVCKWRGAHAPGSECHTQSSHAHAKTVALAVAGEDSCSIEFASNKGDPIREGHFQPGDLIRVSAMTCHHSNVPFAAYNKHFIEGRL